MRAPGQILLLSTYELGHQPLAIALLAAFLERAGFRPALRDLSIAPLDRADVERASLVAISVPMHTALRIGAGVGRRVKAANPRCHLAYFGHYALLHADSLRHECAADSVFGGECEEQLVALAAALAGAIGYVLLGAASRFLAWETVFGSMIRLAGGAAAVGGSYFLLAFLFHSGTVRTIHRREDLLHPPGVTLS